MKKIIFVVLSLFSFLLVAQAQQGFLSEVDALTISVDPIQGMYYEHELKANQTIYRLSKFFKTSTFEINALNQKKHFETYDIGEMVKIPFDPKALYTKDAVDQLDQKFVFPIYYFVQGGDNLYRISSFYFGQDLDKLMEWNGLKSAEISIDQKILVGWMLTDKPRTREKEELAVFEKTITRLKVDASPALKLSAPLQSLAAVLKAKPQSHSAKAKKEDDDTAKEFKEEHADIASKNKLYNQGDTKDVKENKPKEVIKSRKGIAVWNKNHKDQEGLFVLHKTAKVNSIIELNYPLLKRKAFAKVIGNIPDGVYPDEVSLIISPKVAHSLGARDGRIMVDMKYYE